MLRFLALGLVLWGCLSLTGCGSYEFTKIDVLNLNHVSPTVGKSGNSITPGWHRDFSLTGTAGANYLGTTHKVQSQGDTDRHVEAAHAGNFSIDDGNLSALASVTHVGQSWVWSGFAQTSRIDGNFFLQAGGGLWLKQDIDGGNIQTGAGLSLANLRTRYRGERYYYDDGEYETRDLGPVNRDLRTPTLVPSIGIELNQQVDNQFCWSAGLSAFWFTDSPDAGTAHLIVPLNTSLAMRTGLGVDPVVGLAYVVTSLDFGRSQLRFTTGLEF